MTLLPQEHYLLHKLLPREKFPPGDAHGVAQQSHRIGLRRDDFWGRSKPYALNEGWVPMSSIGSCDINVSSRYPNDTVVPLWRVGANGENIFTPWESILPVTPLDINKRIIADLKKKLHRELQNLNDLRKWDNSGDQTRDAIIEQFRQMEEHIWNLYFTITGRMYRERCIVRNETRDSK